MQLCSCWPDVPLGPQARTAKSANVQLGCWAFPKHGVAPHLLIAGSGSSYNHPYGLDGAPRSNRAARLFVVRQSEFCRQDLKTSVGGINGHTGLALLGEMRCHPCIMFAKPQTIGSYTTPSALVRAPGTQHDQATFPRAPKNHVTNVT